MDNYTDLQNITIEDCYKYYNVGMTITINDGQVISIKEESEDE